jgi:hypothetical protein
MRVSLAKPSSMDQVIQKKVTNFLEHQKDPNRQTPNCLGSSILVETWEFHLLSNQRTYAVIDNLGHAIQESLFFDTNAQARSLIT